MDDSTAISAATGPGKGDARASSALVTVTSGVSVAAQMTSSFFSQALTSVQSVSAMAVDSASQVLSYGNATADNTCTSVNANEGPLPQQEEKEAVGAAIDEEEERGDTETINDDKDAAELPIIPATTETATERSGEPASSTTTANSTRRPDAFQQQQDHRVQYEFASHGAGGLFSSPSDARDDMRDSNSKNRNNSNSSQKSTSSSYNGPSSFLPSFLRRGSGSLTKEEGQVHLGTSQHEASTVAVVRDAPTNNYQQNKQSQHHAKTRSEITESLKTCPHIWRFLPPLFSKITKCSYCDELLFVWEGRYPYCQQCDASLHNSCWDLLKKQRMALDIHHECEAALRFVSESVAKVTSSEVGSTDVGTLGGQIETSECASDIKKQEENKNKEEEGHTLSIRGGERGEGALCKTEGEIADGAVKERGGVDGDDETEATGAAGITSSSSAVVVVNHEKAFIALAAEANVKGGFQHVHELTLSRSIVPSKCDVCRSMMVLGSVYSCTGCHFTIHKGCLGKLEELRQRQIAIDAEKEGNTLKGLWGTDKEKEADVGTGVSSTVPSSSSSPFAVLVPSAGRSVVGGGLYAYQLDTDTFLHERMQAAQTKRSILIQDAASMLKGFHKRNPRWGHAFVSPLLMAKLIDKHRARYRQLCEEVGMIGVSNGVGAPPPANGGKSSRRGSTTATAGSSCASSQPASSSECAQTISTSPSPSPSFPSPPLSVSELEEAINALRFATAAYGESYRTNYMSSIIGPMLMRVVARDLLEPKDEVTNKAIVDILGLPREHLLYAKWSAIVLEPSYFVIFDRRTRSLFICFRGSLSDADFLSDSQGQAAIDNEGSSLHAGIFKMMLRVYHDKVMMETVRHFLKAHPDYSLKITGHSLGGALTCLFAMKVLREKPFGTDRKITAYSFAPPPTASLPVAAEFDEHIYSFICGDDIVCRMQVNALDRFVAQIEEVATKAATPEAAVVSATRVDVGTPPPQATASASTANGIDSKSNITNVNAVPTSTSAAATAVSLGPELEGLTEIDLSVELVSIGGGHPEDKEGEGTVGTSNPSYDSPSEVICSNSTITTTTASAAPLSAELHIIGRCLLMPNPTGPNNCLLQIDRTHPLLHQIFLSLNMLEHHFMDAYRRSLVQCLEITKAAAGGAKACT